MGLPSWTDAGLLPPGIHRAELPDLYERFVLDAPDRPHRELLFGALTVHLKLLRVIIPVGLVWINGSFCTRASRPPDDVDIVIRPGDWKALQDVPAEVKPKLYGLVTLQEVAVLVPTVNLPRLQPVGGTVDAFLCYPGHEAVWQERWSRVLDAYGDAVQGQEKGFTEVSW
jgi:hypothetical protein